MKHKLLFYFRFIFQTIIWINKEIKALRDLSEKKTVNKYCYFFFESQLTGLIQNEQNNAISNYLTKSAEYTRNNTLYKTSGTIFSADV